MKNTAKKAIHKFCFQCGQYKSESCNKCTLSPFAPKIKYPTQSEIANHLNCSQTTVSKILNGKYEITRKIAQRLSYLIDRPWFEIMGMSPDEIKTAIRAAMENIS